MEHKKSKRILYSICFLCLVLIDWIRGSQVGVYWLTAVNLTGVFLSLIIMSHFRWRGEPKKCYLGWMMLWFLGSMAGFGIWKLHPGEVFGSQYWAAAISVGFVGIAAIRLWRERKEWESQKAGGNVLLVCWVAMSVLMSCSRMGEIWPLWYLLLFLLFYAVPFTGQERRDLWDGLADALIVSFFVLQIFAYGFRPYDELRYRGAYGNCNMNALFYMVVYLGLLYRSHSVRWAQRRENVGITWKRTLMKLMLWILTAGIWGFLLLTMTRTALLAVIAITVIYGVVEFQFLWKEHYARLFLRGAAFLLGVALLFPAVYGTVRYLPTILHHPIWFEGEYSVEKVHSFDPADSEKYISFEELLEGLGKRLDSSRAKTIQDAATAGGWMDEAERCLFMLVSAELTPQMLQNASEYLLMGEEAASSGKIRLEIYKLYLKHMNLTGHELEEGYFQITEDYHAWHAQNLFLQAGFYYGVIAGILLVVLIAGLCRKAWKLAIKARSCEDVLPLLVLLLFVGYGMLECVWYPGQTILLLTYLVPKIIIDEKRSDIA